MFWLKQFGGDNDNWWLHNTFGEPTRTMEFPGGHPSISLNDTVIFSGIHVKKLIFVGKCIRLPYEPSAFELRHDKWRNRYYWMMDFRNLTRTYGRCWSDYNLNPYELAEDFLDKHSDDALLLNGSNTLNALRRGVSHLKLSPEFGRFLCNAVNSCDR